ncbi:MAG: hypothetical protein AAB897_00635 [Patescibacteria group bacterium]
MPIEDRENKKIPGELNDLLRSNELKEGEAMTMMGFRDNIQRLLDHGFDDKLTLTEIEKQLKKINDPILEPYGETIRTLLEHYGDSEPLGFSPDLTLQSAMRRLELNALARENPKTYERVQEVVAEAAAAEHLEELARALEKLSKTSGITPQTTLGEASERLSNTLSEFDLADKIQNAEELSEAREAIKELLHVENGPIELTPGATLGEAIEKLFDLALWLRKSHMEGQLDKL